LPVLAMHQFGQITPIQVSPRVAFLRGTL
jgi:hypothetical protein